MADFKNIIIGLAITILFSVFVFSLVYAIHDKPDYEDFCSRGLPIKAVDSRSSCQNYSVPAQEEQACWNSGGFTEYEYDENGCTFSHYCNTCSKDYDNSQKNFNFYIFLYSAILGLLAIIGGLYFPTAKSKVNDIVSTGFMFGGLLTLFIGTVIYFSDAERVMRPIIILVELVIVIFVAYKKLRKNENTPKNTKKD